MELCTPELLIKKKIKASFFWAPEGLINPHGLNTILATP